MPGGSNVQVSLLQAHERAVSTIWFCNIDFLSLSLIFTLLISSVSSSCCFQKKLIFSSSSLISYFFSSVISLAVLWKVTFEKRATSLAGNCSSISFALLTLVSSTFWYLVDGWFFLFALRCYLRLLVCSSLSLYLLSCVLVGNFLMVVFA